MGFRVLSMLATGGIFLTLCWLAYSLAEPLARVGAYFGAGVLLFLILIIWSIIN